MWEMASAAAHSERMHMLLSDGWEPFSATYQQQPTSYVTVWFRRDTTCRRSLAVTAGMSERGVG